MKQIYTTTLRLNLADEDDRRAYKHLQQMDKKQYRSYSKAIVANLICARYNRIIIGKRRSKNEQYHVSGC